MECKSIGRYAWKTTDIWKMRLLDFRNLFWCTKRYDDLRSLSLGTDREPLGYLGGDFIECLFHSRWEITVLFYSSLGIVVTVSCRNVVVVSLVGLVGRNLPPE